MPLKNPVEFVVGEERGGIEAGGMGRGEARRLDESPAGSSGRAAAVGSIGIGG